MGRSQREKGKRGERLLRNKLTELFGVECRRRCQFNGTEGDDDVAFIDGVFVECKFVEKLNVREAVERAVADCGESLPIVCHKTSRSDWLVTLRLDDLPALATRLYLTMASEPKGGAE